MVPVRKVHQPDDERAAARYFLYLEFRSPKRYPDFTSRRRTTIITAFHAPTEEKEKKKKKRQSTR